MFSCIEIYLRFVGNLFPNSFEATVKKIHRLLLHVLAHVYQCHWQEVVLFRLQSHLNTVFYHFHLFNKQFNLVEDKEMDVLDDLFQRLHHHAITAAAAAARKCCPAASQSVPHTTSTSVQTGNGVIVDRLSSSSREKKETVVCDSFPVLTMVT